MLSLWMCICVNYLTFRTKERRTKNIIKITILNCTMCIIKFIIQRENNNWLRTIRSHNLDSECIYSATQSYFHSISCIQSERDNKEINDKNQILKIPQRYSWKKIHFIFKRLITSSCDCTAVKKSDFEGSCSSIFAFHPDTQLYPHTHTHSVRVIKEISRQKTTTK